MGQGWDPSEQKARGPLASPGMGGRQTQCCRLGREQNPMREGEKSHEKQKREISGWDPKWPNVPRPRLS